jgi:hypothetical protein
MIYPLTKLEVLVAKLTAAVIVLRWQYGALSSADSVLAFLVLVPITLVLWEFAEHVLVVFLLMIKNGGGWPDQ